MGDREISPQMPKSDPGSTHRPLYPVPLARRISMAIFSLHSQGWQAINNYENMYYYTRTNTIEISLHARITRGTLQVEDK